MCLRAGECRPYVETELTATKNLATDGNWSVTTLCRHKRAYDRIQLFTDSCWQLRMFNFYELVLSRRRRPKLSYDRDQLYLKSCRSTQTFSTRRHKLKLQLVAVSSIVSQGRHTPAFIFIRKNWRSSCPWRCHLDWYLFPYIDRIFDLEEKTLVY